MIVNFINIIIGIVLLILINAIYIYYFLNLNFKIKKMKKVNSKEFYSNIKISRLFFSFSYIIKPSLFLISLTLSIISFVFNSEINYLGFIFTFSYLLDSVFILISFLLIFIYQKNLLIIKLENKIILIDELIDVNNIKSISNDLKRKAIYITYLDDQNEQELLKLKYHWELKDWLNNIIDKKNSFEN